MEQPSKNSSRLTRFKENFGVAGMFLFALIVIIAYLKADNFFGLLNMYSILTPDEISKVIFSIITFDMISSLVIAFLGCTAVYFFVRLKSKALVVAFVFLVLQPATDAIIEVGYSGRVVSGILALVGGALIFWLFWHFLGNRTLNYFKLNYGK